MNDCGAVGGMTMTGKPVTVGQINSSS